MGRQELMYDRIRPISAPKHLLPGCFHRYNLEKLSHALQLPQQKIQKLLIRYPAALDMCPASVISRAAALAEVLEVPAHQAIKVACDCPRVLGLSPDTLTAKVVLLSSVALLLHDKQLCLCGRADDVQFVQA